MTLEERSKFIQTLKRKVREITLMINEWEVEQALVGGIIIDEDLFISEDDFAGYIDVCPKTVRRREMPFSKFGRTTMYKLRDIKYALENNYFPSTNMTIEDIKIKIAQDAKKRYNSVFIR